MGVNTMNLMIPVKSIFRPDELALAPLPAAAWMLMALRALHDPALPGSAGVRARFNLLTCACMPASCAGGDGLVPLFLRALITVFDIVWDAMLSKFSGTQSGRMNLSHLAIKAQHEKGWKFG